MLFGGAKIKAYSAYGELLTEKVSGYGYNGEYYDAATGMLNLRARQYEPAQARFSQRDSLKGSAAAPRSLNAYLYCQNDAINFFDASGAAMVAVNMTDGGGGRKSNSSSSTLFQKAGQTIKNVVSTAASAAAVAKAANDQALKKGLVNSLLKERNNPATVIQQARAKRVQAQASTPTVRASSFLRSTKLTACMTQEEYDAGDEVYGPQISSSTSQLIEAQNEDNIQSAQDNLVIVGGFGVTLQLGIAVAFCFEVTWDPVTSRPSVQLLSGYGEGIPSISFFVYGSYCDAPSLEAYYNSTTTAMGEGALFFGTDRLFLTNNETGELYSGRSFYLSTGFSPEAHVIQYQSLTFHSDSDMPVYNYNFDDLLSSE